MIKTFKCKETEKIFNGKKSTKFSADIQKSATRKLWVLNNSISLNDLTVAPSLRLEALKGDRKGQHSIRINIQYRICFIWQDGNAFNVEIVDYH